MCDESKICVVLLVGIPGSGKSFFRKWIESYFKDNFESELGVVQMFSICYDDYCYVQNPNQLTDGSKWKSKRLEILNIVECVIENITKCNFTALRNICPNIYMINENIHNPDSVVILIDDNMYYRSMRYEYYKLAIAHGLSFCQVFFYVLLDEALRRNRERCINERVPDRVIESMFHRIEPPQNNNIWERDSITISSCVDFQNQSLLNTVFDCIKFSLAHPVKPNEIDLSSVKEESRKITNSNILHQIDNTLKQLVGLIIREEINGCCKSDARKISQQYSDKRLALLKQIKEGDISLPVDLTRTVAQGDFQDLKPIFLDLLKK